MPDSSCGHRGVDPWHVGATDKNGSRAVALRGASLTPAARLPPPDSRVVLVPAAMLMSNADPLPLLRAIFPGYEPAALAALADRLQAAATWRCIHLLRAPPQNCFAASSSQGLSPDCPQLSERPLQQVTVTRGPKGHLILQSRGTGRQLQVQPLAAGPGGPLAQHPQSLAVTALPGLPGTVFLIAVLARLPSGLLLLACGAARPLGNVLYVPHCRAHASAWLDTPGGNGCNPPEWGSARAFN